MKVFSFFAVCALLIACSHARHVEPEVQLEPVKAQLGNVTVKSDPLTIKSASLDGNILSVEVEYSGGCQKHWIELMGSFAVMKSLPPKRTIKLIHGANDDTCRELITESLQFDISLFAMDQKSGSEIILVLDDYKGEISYVYP
jgi:hypothetical protein